MNVLKRLLPCVKCLLPCVKTSEKHLLSCVKMSVKMYVTVCLGVPAITVPVALSSNGLPIGLQLIARPFAERQLLSVAKAVEQLVNFKPLDLSFLDS